MSSERVFNRVPAGRTGIALLAVLAVGLALSTLTSADDEPISRYVFLLVDTPAICATLAVLAAAALSTEREGPLDRAWRALERVPPWSLGLVAAGGAALGVDLVLHRFPWSMDEFATVFQARTFREGYLLAPIPDDWRGIAKAMQAYYIQFSPGNEVWMSPYRPAASLLRALLDLVSLGAFVNAGLAGLSVVLSAAVARRIWPDSREAPLMAALLLATSPQVLVLGMSAYAMPAQLAANLLWLWLLLHDTPRHHVLAALVGAFAIGLHQVNVHPLFALPFLIGMAREGKWRTVALYGAVYGAGAMIWLGWHDLALAGAGVASAGNDGHPAMGSARALWYLKDALKQLHPVSLDLFLTFGRNLVRFAVWVNPALVILLVLALRARPWPPVVRRCAWAVGISMLPYTVLMPDQGHGWGYRYGHALLAALVPIAIHGWVTLSETRQRPGMRRLVVLLTGGTLLVVLPVQLVRVEGTVRPFAAAAAFLSGRPVEVVLVDPVETWYGKDLIRNDPLLRREPKVASLQWLKPDQVRNLCREHTIAVIRHADLAPLGVPGKRAIRGVNTGWERNREALRSPECLRAQGGQP